MIALLVRLFYIRINLGPEAKGFSCRALVRAVSSVPVPLALADVFIGIAPRVNHDEIGSVRFGVGLHLYRLPTIHRPAFL